MINDHIPNANYNDITTTNHDQVIMTGANDVVRVTRREESLSSIHCIG